MIQKSSLSPLILARRILGACFRRLSRSRTAGQVLGDQHLHQTVKHRIAYGLTSDPGVVNVIQEWPGAAVQGRNDTVKIPSVIKYGMSGDDLEPVSFDWGYKVGVKDAGVIRGIKLGLDPEKRKFYHAAVGIEVGTDIVHLHEETTAAETARLQKSTVDIIADYIGAVYEHALSKIRQREIDSYIDSLPKEFVLTVPAIWSDRAKNATLIVRRGLPRYAESVALYCD